MSKILIVDDNADIRELLVMTSKHAGYEACEAKNGEEGLDAVKQQLPDLILLDVMMPKMDGLKMCQLLKSNPQFKSIPIILLTAKDLQIDALLGFYNGADEYLTKPVDLDRLIQVMKRFLSKTPKT